MKLWTDAVDSRGNFDGRYTCDVDNSSPELHWTGAPPKTAGYALLIEDLDTPEVFCHWLVHHIPPHVGHLPAGIAPQDTLPNGIRQGLNSWGRLGYGGPCPPVGHGPHHYRFRLFALSRQPELPGRIGRDALLAAITPLTLASAECEGIYRRRSERIERKAG
jgi:Raf kinase inhibitor-like YbhB/YbcL family protein